MPTVAIPLVVAEAAEPLQGMSVTLSEDSGAGDLPWGLHQRSHEAELELLGSQEQPRAVWFGARPASDDAIREKAIPVLGTLHLLGRGVTRVSEAWVYRERGADPPERRPLALKLLGGGGEFFLAAGVNEEAVATAYERVASALKSAPWLRVTLEHMLLALDRTGLSNGILDLTICLESLIRAEAEVSFRLSHQICALVTSSPSELEDYQSLLHDVYAVRSVHVHGGEPKAAYLRRLNRVEGRFEDLERVMRASVMYAVEFHGTKEATEKQWQQHLGRLLHGSAEVVSVDWGSVP